MERENDKFFSFVFQKYIYILYKIIINKKTVEFVPSTSLRRNFTYFFIWNFKRKQANVTQVVLEFIFEKIFMLVRREEKTVHL